MKKALPWLLALVAGVAIGYFATRGEPDAAYWVSRQQYDRDVEAQEARVAAVVKDSAEKDKVIAAEQAKARAAREERARLEVELGKQHQEDAALAGENGRLKTELQPVIDANPKLRELIRNYDLRLFNKDAQIFNLTQQRDQARTEAKANFDSYLAAASQAASWKTSFQDEHKQRLNGDALRLDLERKYKTSKFWAAVGKWGPPIAGALGYALGHK